MLAEEGGAGIQMTSMRGSPAWVDDVDAVENCLTTIHRQMDQLQSMHASRVGSVFGKDLEDMEGRIEKMTREVTDQFRYAERLLQKVGMATRRAGGEEATVGANIQRRYAVCRWQNGVLCEMSGHSSNLRPSVGHFQRDSLAKRLQELSMTFRQSQRKYLAEVQAQKSGGLVPGADSRFGIDLAAAESTGDFFTTQQMAVVDDLTEAVRSRDQEIAKIAQSIEELGTIFKELAVLVIDQGTILDRIDYNMEAVVEHTKTGIKQLEKAEKSQKVNLCHLTLEKSRRIHVPSSHNFLFLSFKLECKTNAMHHLLERHNFCSFDHFTSQTSPQARMVLGD